MRIIFPWKIFKRTALVLFLINALGFLILLLAYYWLHPFSSTYNQVYQQLQGPSDLAWWVFGFIIFYLLWTLVWVFLLSYLQVLPLAKLFYGIKTLAYKSNRNAGMEKTAKDVRAEAEEFLSADFGEYAEIEILLNRLKRKLRKRKEQVAEAREEAELVMASIADAVLAIDTAEKIVFYNSHFAKHFLPERFNAIEAKLSAVIRLPEVLQCFYSAMKQGVLQSSFIEAASVIDGEKRYYKITASPLLKAKSGQVYTVIGVFHDVTDLKRAERVRNEFVSNASHELRTPLTSIKGYMDTLLGDLQSGRAETALEFAKIISNNVNRLVELVQDLLEISKLESYPSLKLEPFDLGELTHEVVESLEQEVLKKDQVVKISIEESELTADRLKVAQVLSNLVYNAIRYIPEKGVIEIIWQRSLRGEGAELIVRDNGPGIESQHLPRLFERFYRVDRSRSRDQGGTGLGLAIVKHIVEAHGGWVKVKSQVGLGTEFRCYFP